MRVLQVNNVDLIGRRFNGFDLIEPLGRLGIECQMAVLRKASTEDSVTSLCDPTADEPLYSSVSRLERRYGMNGVLFPWGEALRKSDVFSAADVVHYHLIHNNMVSLLDLPRLAKAKPSIWTFHDSWPLTGHCIQPCGCEDWMNGCECCPKPELPFPLPASCSGRMWRLKDSIYSRLDVDIVVATEHMRQRVAQSPLGSHFERVHHIPFGSGRLVVAARSACRATLGIRGDTFAILFRATTAEVKGLKYLVEALRMAPPVRHTTLLVVDHAGLLCELSVDYDIREFGWVNDSLYADLLGACDVVVTPYPWAVGFGLMAAEAMAAARAVVCFEDTSLATITHAPEVGIAVPKCDSLGLRNAIDSLMIHPEDCAARGQAGWQIAQREYTEERYARQMAALYRTVAERSRDMSASNSPAPAPDVAGGR